MTASSHPTTGTTTSTSEDKEALFLGLDLSTQQLKIIATFANLKVHSTYTLEFSTELPHYKTVKGVYVNESTGEIHSSVALWLEALDSLLNRMQIEGFPFAKVKGISGSCQQHGSVFWSKEANGILSGLNPNARLVEQLSPGAFSLQTSPNWQDHSTGQEIKIFESYIEGGAEQLAAITGSRAHYRFTGPQIRKLAKTQPEVYKATSKISLVSSFLHSLFAGELVNIEEADACGMNLYDIPSRNWNDELLAIASMSHCKDGVEDEQERMKAVQDLKGKLGSVVPVGSKPISNIAPYFVSRYGFDPQTHIYSFTGDNLATVIALPLAKDDLLISMGTSTTVLLVTETYRPSSSYHVFIHPTIPNAYMGMICYCNGALARETIRDQINEKYSIQSHGSWDKFNEILDSSSSSSTDFDDKLGVYFPIGEIVPNCHAQTIRGELNPSDGCALETVDSWDIEEDVISIVESQALSCRARASPMLSIRTTTTTKTTSPSCNYPANGLKFDDKLIPSISLLQRPNKVFYVGGGSRNGSIVGKFSSILGSTAGDFKCENSNACALGGAYKAAWSDLYENGKIGSGFDQFLKETYDENELEKLEGVDKWEAYEKGVVLLNLLERQLK